MAAVLFDTDAFSVLHGQGEAAAEVRRRTKGRFPLLPFIVVGELRKGALYAGWGERRSGALETQIASMTVLPFDEVVIDAYARVTADAKRRGHPLGQDAQSNDAWCAACAIAYAVPLVTRNVRHFFGASELVLLG